MPDSKASLWDGNSGDDQPSARSLEGRARLGTGASLTLILLLSLGLWAAIWGCRSLASAVLG
jgi:hypothetical protein